MATNEYQSPYTGAELDAALIMLLAGFVKSFNGRTGPEIQAEVNDYGTNQILVGDFKVPLDYHFEGTNLTELLESCLNYQYPTCTILSYMGTTPPSGYLPCDGKIYDIIQYQNLADEIAKQFGVMNFFGGDGTMTFAVPDLRGEFLRGAGTATRATGSGADPGVHQDPTKHLMIELSSSWTYAHGRADIDVRSENWDTTSGNTNYWWSYSSNSTNNSYNIARTGSYYYSSRPTVTSVLYCIKY